MNQQLSPNFQTIKTLHFKALLLFLFGVMTSCQKSSSVEDMKNVQLCLNKASASEAQSCVSKLGGDSSPEAYQLRCAAYFIEEGYGTPTKLLEALDQANNTTCTNCSASVNMVSALAFTSTTQASNAASVCNASGLTVYSQLSSIVQIATLAKTAAGVDLSNLTPDQVKDAIQDIPDADLGNVIIASYSASCSGEASSDNLAQYCTELGNTLNASNPTDVGACLKYQMTGGTNPGNGCPDRAP